MSACLHSTSFTKLAYRAQQPPDAQPPFPLPQWENLLTWLSLPPPASQILLECFFSHHVTELALPWLTWNDVSYICSATAVHPPSLNVFLFSCPDRESTDWNDHSQSQVVSCLDFLRNCIDPTCGCTAASILQQFFESSPEPWLQVVDEKTPSTTPTNIMSNTDMKQFISSYVPTQDPLYSQLHTLRKILFSVPKREFHLSRRFCLQAATLIEIQALFKKCNPSLTVTPRPYAHPSLPRHAIDVFSRLNAPLPFPPSGNISASPHLNTTATHSPPVTDEETALAAELLKQEYHDTLVMRALAGYLMYAIDVNDAELDGVEENEQASAVNSKKRALTQSPSRCELSTEDLSTDGPDCRRKKAHDDNTVITRLTEVTSRHLTSTGLSAHHMDATAPATDGDEEKQERDEEDIPPELHGLLAHGILNRWVPALAMNATELRSLLVRPDFSIFRLPLKTHPETLLQLSFFFFHDLRLPQILGISPVLLYRALSFISEAYSPANQYHNWYHGFATLHHTWVLLKCTLLHVHLTPVQLFGTLLSAAAHDIGHPGNDNRFECNVKTAAAEIYAGQSVLENHHCTLVLALLCDPQHNCNVMAGLSPENYRSIRRLLVACVLGTDMFFHHEITRKTAAMNTLLLGAPECTPMPGLEIPTELRNRPCPTMDQIAQSGPQIAPTPCPSPQNNYSASCSRCAAYSPAPAPIQEKPLTATVAEANAYLEQALEEMTEHPIPWEGTPRQLPQLATDLICRVLVHTADISCQSLCPRIVLAWSERLRVEFSRQSQREQVRGLPLTPHMLNLDDTNTHARAQVGFVRAFMWPLWLELARLCPGIDVSLTYLCATSHMWDTVAESGELDVMDVEGLHDR